MDAKRTERCFNIGNLYVVSLPLSMTPTRSPNRASVTPASIAGATPNVWYSTTHDLEGAITRLLDATDLVALLIESESKKAAWLTGARLSNGRDLWPVG
jgi:hypothetical protein